MDFTIIVSYLKLLIEILNYFFAQDSGFKDKGFKNEKLR